MSAAVRMGPLAALLAALAMIGPFAIDTYLPAFRAIRDGLGASAVEMQQTLSVYLVVFAVMMLFHGTLSDSFGRRPVVVANLALFTLASAGCALSTTFEQLLLFRAVQGASAGAGIVVGRAIIRDSFEGHAAQRLMALVTILFGLAPAVAPIAGAWLQETFGWRAVFGFLAVYGALVLAACGWRLPETLSRTGRQPFRLAILARNYWTLGRSAPLFLISMAVAFNFSGFFLYILSAPAFVYDLLGLTAADFPWLFMPGVIGVMAGAGLSSRLAGRVSPAATVNIAFGVMFSAAALNLIWSGLAAPALPWSVAPILVYTVGMGLGMPSLTLAALDLFPNNRGLTASLIGFAHSLIAGLTAGVVSPLTAHDAFTLALGMAGLLAAGWSAWAGYCRMR